ncbi:hypothetical protein [Marinifilum sp.]
MKNLFITILSIIALASCSNFESEIPLGDPGGSKLDEKFLGK